MRERPFWGGLLHYPVILAVVTMVAFLVVNVANPSTFEEALGAGLLALLVIAASILVASAVGPYWTAKWSEPPFLRCQGRGLLAHLAGFALAFPIYDFAFSYESPGFGRFVEFSFGFGILTLPVPLVSSFLGARAGRKRRNASRVLRAPSQPETNQAAR